MRLRFELFLVSEEKGQQLRVNTRALPHTRGETVDPGFVGFEYFHTVTVPTQWNSALWVCQIQVSVKGHVAKFLPKFLRPMLGFGWRVMHPLDELVVHPKHV